MVEMLLCLCIVYTARSSIASSDWPSTPCKRGVCTVWSLPIANSRGGGFSSRSLANGVHAPAVARIAYRAGVQHAHERIEVPRTHM